jgi:hypothetical protein
MLLSLETSLRDNRTLSQFSTLKVTDGSQGKGRSIAAPGYESH